MKKAEDYVGKHVKVTKLTDTRFNGEHPNGINEGYSETGTLPFTPEPGDSLYVVPMKLDEAHQGGLRTSVIENIEELTDHLLITTLNSVYKVELI